MGGVRCEFLVGGIELETNLLVSDEIEELMLGIDWLKQVRAKWDVDDSTLSIQGVSIPLRLRRSRASCRRVYASGTVSIPTNTEQNVPVKMAYNDLHATDDDWVMNPAELSDGVYVARVLMSNDNDNAAIRLVNLSQETFNIPDGYEVGTARAAQIMETDLTGSTEQDSLTGPLDYRRPVIESLPDDLHPAHRRRTIRLIVEYKDVFSRHEYDLGRTDLITHTIDTGTARPIRQPLRRHPQVHLDVIDREIDKMIQSGVVEPSNSPWASNVVVVTKHDNTPRITLDYRQLNDVTRKDSFPLPNIADCLDAFKGASMYGILDLRSSFYQVPLAEQDRDKTAFITRKGLYQFRSLPMGLSNSPGTFQRLMNLVMRGLTWISCLVYIDDIVLFANDFEQFTERLQEVFERLRQANLKLKPSKVKLYQPEIGFLGHRISAAGVAVDPEKVEKITHWPVPRNAHEIKQFMGLCGYYRRYIKDFAKFASPLNELTKHDVEYVWGERQQQSFFFLKECLTSAPILAMSTDVGTFVLDVDASNWAAGAVLQQEQDGLLRVIAYGRRTFSRAEQNY